MGEGANAGGSEGEGASDAGKEGYGETLFIDWDNKQ